MGASLNEELWNENAERMATQRDAEASSRFAPLLVKAYGIRRLRSICLSLCNRLEHGSFYSRTLREILSRYHGVAIGKYSYGPILTPGILPVGTIVGNYCSIGAGLVVLRRNHPFDRLSQHPFFYNSGLGYLRKDTIPSNSENPLTIGHDVWIGERVSILAGCKSVGNGAVIAAGSVVTRDVPPYTIVAGVPAKKLKMRFEEEVADGLEKLRWWELNLTSLLTQKKWILQPLTVESLNYFNNLMTPKK